MSLRLRLFITFGIVVLLSIVFIAVGMSLLMRNYVDRQSLSRLEDMTRPIYVQIVALIRGNVTPLQLLNNLQEQADKNGAYILLVDNSGNIVRQLIPLQPESLPAIEVAPDTMPHEVTSSLEGKFTTTDGRNFLYSAYPLTRQGDQLSSVETLVLAIPQQGTLSVLLTFIWPFFISAGIALIISLLIAVFLARSIYRPLSSVTEAARQISHGDYSKRIQSQGPKEIKELADTFNQMTENIEQAHLRLRHFVADVSHELKSPLTSIQGFSQALIDGTAGDKPTMMKAANIINQESKRMRRQVDELLDLSRMQSGQFKMAKETVSVGEILRHCYDVFEVQAKEKGIQMELKAGLPLNVTGDSDRLEQVFSNLLDNAMKNTPSGCKVQTFASKTNYGFVEVKVKDEGPGIHPEQLPYVFERFYQVTGVRTGVGLGLTIAREIVRAHNGTIEVKSEPGEGAEFIVRLPVTTPDSKPDVDSKSN